MSRKKYFLFVLIAIIAIVLFLFSAKLFPQGVSSLNRLSSQFFYYLTPDKENLAKEIVIVQIDDYSLSKINKTWPFPRSFYAKALDILREGGARALGFDIVFQGKGPSVDDDELLREALAKLKGKVVLAAYFTPEGKLESSELLGDVADITFVHANKDDTGLVKSIKGVVGMKSFFKFHFALEVISKYLQTPLRKQAEDVAVGKLLIPLDSQSDLPINYLLKPRDFATISFYDLVEGDFAPGLFKDKIVLLGTTAEIVHDIVSTPLGRMPGVFLHANVISNVLKGKYLTVVHPAFALLILFLGLAATALIIISFDLMRGFVFCLGVLVGLFWLTLGLRFIGWDLFFGAIAISVFSFFILGNLANYFSFLAVLTKIKGEMTIEPFTRLFRTRYFYERLKLAAGSFPRKKRRVVVLTLEGFSDFSKGKDFQTMRKVWNELNAVLFENGELWSRCAQEALVGATTQRIDLSNLIRNIKALFFEQEVPIKVKAAMFVLEGDLNIRDLVPFVIEELAKSQEEVIFFSHSQLPQFKAAKVQEADSISSLYTDSETKNRELLDAIEKKMTEEKKRQDAYLQFIASLVNALESKDPYTEGHSEKVTKYSLLLADALGVSAQERQKIKIAAMLHDLGKIGIPDNVLHKKGKLTEDEFAFIKEHEIMSIRILEPLEELKEIAPYILHHHENYDGSGYPHGLAGNFIPFGARVIAIADVFDALTTGRDYKDAFSIEKSLEILGEEKGKRFDPEMVDVFVKLIKEGYGNLPKK